MKDNLEPAIAPISHRSPTRRRRWLVAATIILALLGSLSWWFVHITARHPYIGNTDPATGYHYEFTLAQGWQRKKEDHPDNDRIKFDLPSPNLFQTWLGKYFLHKPANASNFGDINNLMVETDNNTTNGFILRDGFPTLDLKPTNLFGMRILEEKHSFVSGQPTTWFVLTIDSAVLSPGGTNPGNANDNWYAIGFVVKIQDKPLWYTVAGVSDSAHRQQIGNEVRAIRDSFRIERVSQK